MKSSFLRFVLPLAALAFVAPPSAFAAPKAGGGGGEVAPSGPVVIPGGTYAETYVISEPGSYVLGGNRHVSDPSKTIITVTTPDVTIDLGGFMLSHPTGSNNAGSGISITHAVDNVEISNGSIVDAAHHGVWAYGNYHRIAGLRIVSARHTGISASGQVRVENCQVTAAGTNGIHVSDFSSIADSGVRNSPNGIKIGGSARVERCRVQGGSVGVEIGSFATIVDSFVGGASTRAIWAGTAAVVRNCEVMSSAVGLTTIPSTVLVGVVSRGCQISVSSQYVNGGGNTL